MAIRDRLLDAAQDFTGLAVLPKEELDGLRESMVAYQDLATEAEDLAFHSLNYFGGRPQELRPERRKRIAQKARVAWMQDPVAGTESEHYANFALGRGVSKPLAKDKDVQAIIDEGWTDSSNYQHLTSLDALRAISNELRAGCNVFPIAYVGNGQVKVAFLDADTVTDIVSSDDDRQLPLYYLTRTVSRKWDYTTDQLSATTAAAEVKYYAHWTNVEDLAAVAKANGIAAPPAPPKDKLGEGLVYHVRMNRLLEQSFGTPLGARTLRFFSALNRLLESRVSMAQAASSIIAKRVIKGGPQDVMKAAQNILQQTGEIGAATTARQAFTGMKPPTRPGSTRIENESDTLQAFSLNSGAAQGAQDIQQVRGQAIAPSALGQHYYGDQSSTSLSTGAVLELPALVAMSAFQEIFEQLLRWFTDLLIQEAVRAGRLGGNVREPGDTGPALTELRLCEAQDLATAEQRTKKDLSYSFQMPYPGRRDVEAVATAFQTVMTQLSPIGENAPLTKAMLNWLFTNGFEFENAAELADEVAKAQAALIQDQKDQQAEQQQQQLDLQMQAQQAATQQAAAQQGGTSMAGSGGSTAQYGAKMRGSTGTNSAGQGVQESWLPPGVDAELEQLIGEIEQLATQSLGRPIDAAAFALNGSH